MLLGGGGEGRVLFFVFHPAITFLAVCLWNNKNALRKAFSLACLEIRSRNEEAMNSTRNGIYSLKVFCSLPTLATSSILQNIFSFYLFLNWLSTRASDDLKYVWSRRLCPCINARKLKGLDSREITSLPEIEKIDLHGTSFQPSPKINRKLITRAICIQSSTTTDHRRFAN